MTVDGLTPWVLPKAQKSGNVGWVYSMVILPKFRMERYRVHYHLEGAYHFKTVFTFIIDKTNCIVIIGGYAIGVINTNESLRHDEYA